MMLRFSAYPSSALHEFSQSSPSLSRADKKTKPSLSLSTAFSPKPGSSPNALNNTTNQVGLGARADGDVRSRKLETSGKWDPTNDEEMLSLMDGFVDTFPIMRTYRNRLCNVEVCGNAARSSVLTAMASDQSFTAASNVKKNRPLTVLQTVLPGAAGGHSTISTKLFAPSFQVAERAKRLSLPKGLSSREFVHKFFEAVQMLQLSKFYIEIYAPGTRRDTSALDREEMAQIVFSFESTSKSALDHFGKAISSYAISCIKDNAKQKSYLKSIWGTSKWIPSLQSPVRFCMLSVQEIENQARKLKESSVLFENPPDLNRFTRSWWPISASLMDTARKSLDKATDDWIYERLFMHKLQIDANVLDASVAGGSSLQKESREILLTHAQVVDLANSLDMYYEDRFTLSDKSLESGAFIDFQDVPKSKVAKFIDAATIGGTILGLGIFAWLVAARLRKPSGLSNSPPAFDTETVIAKSEQSSTTEWNRELAIPVNENVSGDEMESLCKLVIAKLVEAFSWDLHIQSCAGKGAWTTCNSQSDSFEVSTSTEAMDKQSTMKNGNSADEAENSQGKLSLSQVQHAGGQGTNVQERLLYQVTISRDGSILGFQPLNTAAVSSWAVMPFVSILYGRQNLAPGFLEWPLKYRPKPANVVVLELSLSMDRVSPYASVKPVAL